MAKLVDALPSGGSVRKNVQVRILFWALRLFIFVDLSLNYLRSAIKLPSVDYVINRKKIFEIGFTSVMKPLALKLLVFNKAI